MLKMDGMSLGRGQMYEHPPISEVEASRDIDGVPVPISPDFRFLEFRSLIHFCVENFYVFE